MNSLLKLSHFDTTLQLTPYIDRTKLFRGGRCFDTVRCIQMTEKTGALPECRPRGTPVHKHSALDPIKAACRCQFPLWL